MENDVQKPHKQRGLMSRVKSWLTRPGTIKVAFAIMRLVAWVAKVFDLF
jgi:hypothetical protein